MTRTDELSEWDVWPSDDPDPVRVRALNLQVSADNALIFYGRERIAAAFAPGAWDRVQKVKEPTA